jgi:hypothetical protein
LKPDGSLSQDGGPGRETKSRQSSKTLRETLHCENDQTKLNRFLTTGMFYLIVKDPCRVPPERSALDQGIHSMRCASSNWLRCIVRFPTTCVGGPLLRASSKTIEVLWSCQGICFPLTGERVQHQI